MAKATADTAATAVMVTLRQRIFALDQSLLDSSASTERLAAVAAGHLLDYVYAIDPTIFDTCETLRDAICGVPPLTEDELTSTSVASERLVEGFAAVYRIISARKSTTKEGKKEIWFTIEYEPQWVPVEDFRGDMVPLIVYFGEDMPEKVQAIVQKRTPRKGTTIIHRFDEGKSFPIDRTAVKDHQWLPNNNIEVYVQWGRYEVESAAFQHGAILSTFDAGRRFQRSLG